MRHRYWWAPGGCWAWVSVLAALPVTKPALALVRAVSVTFISFPVYFLIVIIFFDVGQ